MYRLHAIYLDNARVNVSENCLNLFIMHNKINCLYIFQQINFNIAGILSRSSVTDRFPERTPQHIDGNTIH